MPKDSKAGLNLPENTEELRARLAEMNEAELSQALTSLREKFDTQFAAAEENGFPADALTELETLKGQVEAAEAREAEVVSDRESRQKQAEELRNAVQTRETGDKDGDGDGGESGDGNGDAAEGEQIDPAATAEPVAAGNEATVVAAMQAMTETANGLKAFATDYLKPDTDLNKRTRLGEIAKYAPDANVHEQREEPVIVASADVPGYTQGGQLESMDDLSRAMHKRARMLPTTRSGNPNVYPVASLQREFTFTLNENTTPTQMNEVLTAAADEEILTAAGGWCAPSEISYDFFNIVCEDGMVDLPTVGINRGGVQYPTSPSFGDLASNTDIVWTWTEQDDIDAVDSDSVFKPCVRVDCPSFIDRRLDCDGFCVTAGNLIEFAYPELISNWLRLVMAIRAKATNARIIDLMLNGGGSGDAISASLAVDHTGLLGATTSALLSSIELSITDYREKFSMCSDAILEVVLPRWANAVIRADLANRDGIDVFSVTNGMIADWFNLRSARVQFVGDWQVRDTDEPGQDTPITAWPTTIDYMVYAPGTFVRGNGMSLDLGVVRDSTLNAKNDHTAAWAEDCYALLKPGHESRVVTTSICNSGEIGDRSITCAA